MPEKCVCCGTVIPEGRMVCPMCEKGIKTRGQGSKDILKGETENGTEKENRP